MNPDSKYVRLYDYLLNNGMDEVTLSLDAIESLLGDRLPASARSRRAWWSNRRSGAVQASAWMDAGYHVHSVDLESKQIEFRRANFRPDVKRVDGEVSWTAELVRALRHYMDMTQAQFARELNVRQSTISEWEGGAYEPRGASVKVLTLVAERTGFLRE